MEHNKVNIEQIESMTDEQWENYRLEKWKAKKKQATIDPPPYFLEKKESYIAWIKRAKENGNSKIKLDVGEIERMSPEDWQTFRRERWAKKNNYTLNDVMPKWFMQKESYIKKLKKK
jgi:hypothetical protein